MGPIIALFNFTVRQTLLHRRIWLALLILASPSALHFIIRMLAPPMDNAQEMWEMFHVTMHFMVMLMLVPLVCMVHGVSLVGADVEDGDDIRVGELGSGAGFGLETSKAIGRGSAIRCDQLDRDLTPQARVTGAVDLPHPPCTQRLHDLVRAQTRSARERHSPLTTSAPLSTPGRGRPRVRSRWTRPRPRPPAGS